jgi:hypothetical protein
MSAVSTVGNLNSAVETVGMLTKFKFTIIEFWANNITR